MVFVRSLTWNRIYMFAVGAILPALVYEIVLYLYRLMAAKLLIKTKLITCVSLFPSNTRQRRNAGATFILGF